jgi:hypothetical protein
LEVVVLPLLLGQIVLGFQSLPLEVGAAQAMGALPLALGVLVVAATITVVRLVPQGRVVKGMMVAMMPLQAAAAGAVVLEQLVATQTHQTLVMAALVYRPLLQELQ